MHWEAWLTLGLIALAVIGLLRNWFGPDAGILAVLAGLVTFGAVFGSDKLPSAATALQGFGNSGLITVALLFVVARGLTLTGATSLLTGPLLGSPRSASSAQVRLLPPVSLLSAFVNNTPIVAMFIPAVMDWSRRTGIPASKLLMPLSYAAILGGTCTLVGTSTNLVVYGLLDDALRSQIGLFTIAMIGLPITLVGLAYIFIASPYLLPGRISDPQEWGDSRNYTAEMMVEKGGPIDGLSIARAGLRSLTGLYLAEIERGDERIVAVGPEQVLKGGDRLIFVGVVNSVVELQKMRGLTPATTQVFKLNDPRPNRELIEVVVSESCPVIGKTIREGEFRGRYQAVVLAVHRNGELLKEKIGDVVLRPGDTLLVEAHPRFVEQQQDRRDFFLVSSVKNSKPLRYHRAWHALAILGAMVLVVALGWMSMIHAAFLAAGVMVLLRCLSVTEARDAIDIRTVLVIAGAIGIGEAMRLSGAADYIANAMLGVTEPLGPWAVLLGVYIITVIMTEAISNVGAAVLVLPIAQAAANTMGVDLMPFVFAVMVGASASFATPIGYQTNLMVYGAGGYQFKDYLRFGLPLTIITGILVVVLNPLIWPFRPEGWPLP